MKIKKLYSGIEPAMLAGFISVAALLLVFFWVSHGMAAGTYQDLDQRLSAAMRGPVWVQTIMRDLSSLGSFPVLILLICCASAYLVMTQRARPAAFFIATVLSGGILSQALKNIYNRPRPDMYEPLVETFTSSFPSAHAMMAATVYLSMGLLIARLHRSRRVRVFMIGISIFLTVVIGVSRVYLAVHWPSDILAGWVIGTLVVLLFWMLEHSMGRMKDRTQRDNPA